MGRFHWDLTKNPLIEVRGYVNVLHNGTARIEIMKKFLSNLVISGIVLGSGQVLSTEHYDIDVVSGSIVARLTTGTEVPESDITELFSLVESSEKRRLENRKLVKAKNEENNKQNEIDDIIKKCIELMIEQNKVLNKPSKLDKNINRFEKQIDQLKNNFTPTTIEHSLSIILEMY